MTRETVQLVNMMIQNLSDNKYDDNEVELIFNEIRVGRTKMTLKMKETISIFEEVIFVITCDKCGYKSTVGEEHNCQPAANDK